MACIQYNDAAFRALFPAYANTTTYPQATIQGYWNTSTVFINNQTGGCYCGGMNFKQQVQALNLMTAHLLYISGLIVAGKTPVIVQGAGIDKINVTLEPPPLKNNWQYWLNTSPYGQQLLALLQLAACGGFYIGGVPELSAFRRVGGYVS